MPSRLSFPRTFEASYLVAHPDDEFTHSRSSSGSKQGDGRNFQRKKATGLNSRFNHMVETMNNYPSRRPTTHTSISSHVQNPRSSPMNASSGSRPGQLGETFSVIKLKERPRHINDEPISTLETDSTFSRDVSNNVVPSPTKLAPEALPDWLYATISTLEPKHPLRLLLPKEHSRPSISISPIPKASPEPEQPFAFSPVQLTGNTSRYQPIDHISYEVPHTPVRGSLRPETYLKNSPSTFDVISTLDILPFSTPGPQPVTALPPRYISSPHTSPRVHEEKQSSHLHTELGDVDFIPFTTPGPGLGSSLAAIADIDRSPNPNVYASSPPRGLRFLNSSGNILLRSPVDSCLPPYNSSPSDPAPAYSSDEMHDYGWTSIHTEHHISDRPLIDNIDSVTNRYLNSPFAQPERSNPSTKNRPLDPEPANETDYSTIDFKWRPFNRKGTNYDLSSFHTDQFQQINQNPTKLRHTEAEANQPTESTDEHPRRRLLTPECRPSPDHFRHSTSRGLAGDPGPFTLESTLAPDVLYKPQPRRVSLPAFAPAPEIHLSPFRH